MKNILSFLLLFIVNNFYGQINFEKGYFKDNNGKQTDCFIKNEDWKNNPYTFKYKLQRV